MEDNIGYIWNISPFSMFEIIMLFLYLPGSLQIRHSQESDEGKYECVAENEVGVAYSYGANLYVRGKITIKIGSPKCISESII